MAAIVITENEILEALTEATRESTDSRTVGEFCTMTGFGKDAIKKAIGRLAMQNRVEVSWVRRPDIAGRITSRPAYKILPPQKKGGKK